MEWSERESEAKERERAREGGREGGRERESAQVGCLGFGVSRGYKDLGFRVLGLDLS